VAQLLAALVRHGEQLQRRAADRDVPGRLEAPLLARPLPAGRRKVVLEQDRRAQAFHAERPPRADSPGEGGSSEYGDPARMLFWAGDASGITRYVVELYDGTKMVFGARTDWRPGERRSAALQ
jgi:hypothetical protein